MVHKLFIVAAGNEPTTVLFSEGWRVKRTWRSCTTAAVPGVSLGARNGGAERM
jgi:hypothetical protein